MTPDEILKAFDNVRVWQRGDRRAPHKPLLILMALGSLARGETPRFEFAPIEGKLGRLLEEVGPSDSSTTCISFLRVLGVLCGENLSSASLTYIRHWLSMRHGFRGNELV